MQFETSFSYLSDFWSRLPVPVRLRCCSHSIPCSVLQLHPWALCSAPATPHPASHIQTHCLPQAHHPVPANWNLPLTSTSLLFSLFVPIELLPLLAVSRAGTTEICWSGILTELHVASTCLDALYLHSPRVAHLYNCSYPLFAKLSSK